MLYYFKHPEICLRYEAEKRVYNCYAHTESIQRSVNGTQGAPHTQLKTSIAHPQDAEILSVDPLRFSTTDSVQHVHCFVK